MGIFQIRIISLLVFNIFLTHRQNLLTGSRYQALCYALHITNLILTTLEVLIIPILHTQKLRHEDIKVQDSTQVQLQSPCSAFVDKGESTKREVQLIIQEQEQFSADNSLQHLNFKLTCLSCKNNTVKALYHFFQRKILKIASGHRAGQFLLGSTIKRKKDKSAEFPLEISVKRQESFVKSSKHQLGNKLNRFVDSLESTNW